VRYGYLFGRYALGAFEYIIIVYHCRQTILNLNNLIEFELLTTDGSETPRDAPADPPTPTPILSLSPPPSFTPNIVALFVSRPVVATALNQFQQSRTGEYFRLTD